MASECNRVDCHNTARFRVERNGTIMWECWQHAWPADPRTVVFPQKIQFLVPA